MAQHALARVDWDAALRSAQNFDPILAASLRSLSALFAPDFATGLANIRKAQRADPFNPLHTHRLSLFFARFGDLADAGGAIEALRRHELPAPIIDYLRALFALRGGRADQTRAIAASVETAHPAFVLAKFLRAEAQIVSTSRISTVERYLRPLPAGPRWQAAWADLLIKLILLHPQEGPGLAARYVEKHIGPGSPLHAALQRVLGWVNASAPELIVLLQAEALGSRAEMLLLECLVDKLERAAAEPNMAASQSADERASRMLADLKKENPHRPAVRRIFHAFLTRRATALASANRYEEALRLVERSLSEEPHDLIYYQNRAALFTLMRESDSYHDAWAALNAHQYRLLLLGETGGQVIGQVIRTHRLFAQQALGLADGANRGGGLFRSVADEDGNLRPVFNGDAIASDPDLLRQWLHHRRAELLFRHLALGDDARRALLEPQDQDDALARADTLRNLAKSLPILAAEEGQALSETLARRWRSAVSSIRTRYPAKPPSPAEEADGDAGITPPAEAADEDSQVRDLKEEHLAALAEACLICVRWYPQSESLWIAEEILAFALDEIAFADIGLLARLERRSGGKLPYTMQILASSLRRSSGEERLEAISPEIFRAAVEVCVAELLSYMALSAYYGHRGTAKEGASNAMDYIHRARSFRSANAQVELTAARLLSLGEFYDESRKALERFRHLVKPDETYAIEQADKLDDLLQERREKGEAGSQFHRDWETDIARGGDAQRVAELLSEIDDAPTSWRLYADLVRELVVSNRLEDAIMWADRCVARCLSRSEQMHARGLAVEARGMKILAQTSSRSAKLYAAGAYEPARRALDALAERGPLEYPLLYLLGRCQLAAGLPGAASASFQAAAALCDQAIYRTILRRMADDIDQVYLGVARGMIDRALKSENFAEAVGEACHVFSRLNLPAAWLIDFARVFYSVALGTLGAESERISLPLFKFEATWWPHLEEALSAPTDIDRAVRIAALAAELHPATAAAAKVLHDRALELQQKFACAAALNTAGRLLSERAFDQTLDMLDRLDAAIAGEPRLRRMRILALLGAQRFGEADAAVAAFGPGDSAEIRKFLDDYPSLAFRQRVGLVQRLLRDGRAREAQSAMEGLRAPGAKEELELAYCRAFALALEAYALRRQGDVRGARARFEDAVTLLEPYMQRPELPPHIVEFFDRLDMEVEHVASP